MYYESTLVQVVQKVVVHKQFFRQSHCFKYIVAVVMSAVSYHNYHNDNYDNDNYDNYDNYPFCNS
jgi:hypothetical protein